MAKTAYRLLNRLCAYVCVYEREGRGGGGGGVKEEVEGKTGWVRGREEVERGNTRDLGSQKRHSLAPPHGVFSVLPSHTHQATNTPKFFAALWQPLYTCAGPLSTS